MLIEVLENTKVVRISFDSLEVAKRWMVEEGEGSDKKPKRFLSRFEVVRSLIYRPAFDSSHKKQLSVETSLAYSDLAYRACAYERLETFTVEDIREAYQKDGAIAASHLLRNLHIWRDENLREALSSVVNEADATYFDGELFLQPAFESIYYDHLNKNPNWFSVDE
jgi:hypothetical protein